ncbi:MAG: TRAP transporter small permease [Phycisphaerae bacterium]|nr:TRAP transporter small permease [Phycisphaerae bacterium]
MIEFLGRLEGFLQKALLAAGALFLLIMVGLTSLDISVRVFASPIPGVYELMGYFGALVVACSLAYTQRRKDHIAVDILVMHYPKVVQRAIESVNRAACMLFSGLAAWQIGKLATTLMKSGELTETLRIVYYPFAYGVAAGFGLLAVVFLAELIRSLAPVRAEAESEQEQPV